MIASKHRFHGYASLTRVYKQGGSTRSQLFSLKYLQNPKRRSYRLAVVVSKKVDKSAVGRNRIRRRIYEIVRNLEPQISGAYDLVITAYSDKLAEQTSEQLQNDIRSVFEQAGVIATNQK